MNIATSFSCKLPRQGFPAVTAALLAGVLFSGSTLAAESKTPDPYAMADETWITINGTVESVRPDLFTLDYGEGVVAVEMDDGDRDADAYNLVAGDDVTVSGRIDDDFFETTTIEASAVYVKGLGTTFFSSSIDEEDRETAGTFVTAPVPLTYMTVQGRVTRVSDDEFIVDTGNRQLTVATDELGYDPLDNKGYQKIEVGDRVRVSGKIEYEFFGGREINADSVIELYRSPS